MISQRTADQHECSQKQSVRLDHPLRFECRGIQIVLDGGQGDVHHRAIDERYARAEKSPPPAPIASRMVRTASLQPRAG
jgi:hypothetical protein